ncbi:hypothetical protein VIN01S_35930 [Vibrio inusitatus NBRC 102082]|uniref:Uncharacterized protein n=1 Tax=Vibrio inusitatus NBRC 102082 TaxID=1219070 RepID=A0A4Y3I022_9VIBR|nr:hypothetical protein VIN01S_35930 [Vibrio inusitatus NBRC 102082]
MLCRQSVLVIALTLFFIEENTWLSVALMKLIDSTTNSKSYRTNYYTDIDDSNGSVLVAFLT